MKGRIMEAFLQNTKYRLQANKLLFMVKTTIRNLFHMLGFDVVRYIPQVAKTSIRSEHLTLHKTATGDYYLPTDAKADLVANTIINNGIFEEGVVNLARKYIKPG